MQFEDMDNDNEGHHEVKQSKDIGGVQEQIQEKTAAKPDIAKQKGMVVKHCWNGAF